MTTPAKKPKPKPAKKPTHPWRVQGGPTVPYDKHAALPNWQFRMVRP